MHTGDAQNICLCTSNLSIEIGWFNYLIGRVTSKDRRSTVSCMRWLLWQVHKLASKSCFAEEPQVSLLANWTTYSPLILPKHSKNKIQIVGHKRTHTHKSLCQHWTFFPLHVDTSWLHGPEVTSAASRRHAAKADNVRLLLQRDLNGIHQLFRRRWEGCQAKSSMHFHFQNGYSRSWKFIQWCDCITIYYMYLHLDIDHGTMDRVEVVQLCC